MIKLGAGILITAVVLGVAAFGALRGGPVAASGLVVAPEAVSALAAQTRPAQQPPTAPQQVVPEDADGTPYIGIMVHGIGPDTADKMGIDGGVRVVRVLEGGPSEGVLLADDVIVAVDGSDVATVRDLRDAIGAATVGDTVVITAVRGNDTLDLSVAVADRPDEASKPRVGKDLGDAAAGPDLLSGDFGGMLGHLRSLEQSFVRGEIVLETDNGFKTVTAVKGTISEIDVASGSFTLAPKDGSDPIDYQISDDTVVGMVHSGDLGGLNTEDETLVVSVDGKVRLVQQSSLLDIRSMKGLRTIAPLLGAGGPGGLGLRLPDIRAHMDDTLRDLDRLRDKDGGRSMSETLFDRIRKQVEEAEARAAGE